MVGDAAGVAEGLQGGWLTVVAEQRFAYDEGVRGHELHPLDDEKRMLGGRGVDFTAHHQIYHRGRANEHI